MIYAIQMGDGPIKIGKAVNPKSRMAELSTGAPYRLRILAQVNWHDSNEKLLHAYLRFHRLNGEWFEPCPQVLAVVEKMASGNAEDFFDLMSLINQDPEAKNLAFGTIQLEAYNAYQREYMRKRRIMKTKPVTPPTDF